MTLKNIAQILFWFCPITFFFGQNLVVDPSLETMSSELIRLEQLAILNKVEELTL